MTVAKFNQLKTAQLNLTDSKWLTETNLLKLMD